MGVRGDRLGVFVSAHAQPARRAASCNRARDQARQGLSHARSRAREREERVNALNRSTPVTGTPWTSSSSSTAKASSAWAKPTAAE